MRSPHFKCPGRLIATAVLILLQFGAGPAFASRCADAHRDGMAAFNAAQEVQSETRRLIRERATAVQRLEVIDREITDASMLESALSERAERSVRIRWRIRGERARWRELATQNARFFSPGPVSVGGASWRRMYKRRRSL